MRCIASNPISSPHLDPLSVCRSFPPRSFPEILHTTKLQLNLYHSEGSSCVSLLTYFLFSQVASKLKKTCLVFQLNNLVKSASKSKFAFAKCCTARSWFHWFLPVTTLRELMMTFGCRLLSLDGVLGWVGWDTKATNASKARIQEVDNAVTAFNRCNVLSETEGRR